MDKGNTNKHRYSYSGNVKAVEESKWGHDTAARRYGEPRSPNMKAKDMSQPQDPIDKRGPGWANDVANDWRRGAGGDGRPPNFDKGKR
jgi:hypothetical protein